ncbi:hypothetical protein [Nonomuraea sp. SBT364]|uniref:hypothetical protein n=1 Tax=Nonomuraea sp. SBT364 TaxID=1580530 RepID=UPI00066C2817|nr:hypothetical protein [Nonomuraea sp. SBT364]
MRRVRERLAADPRLAVLAYVGDHDAGGEAILTDWLARTSGCWLAVEQVALTREQVLEYGLPAAPGKASDPRWPAFAARHALDPAAPTQWEAEALDLAGLSGDERTQLAGLLQQLAATLAEGDD